MKIIRRNNLLLVAMDVRKIKDEQQPLWAKYHFQPHNTALQYFANESFTFVTIRLFLLHISSCNLVVGGVALNITFGQKLKKLREEKGLSQEGLAKELNVSRQAVYKWEADKGYPDIENLINISDLFEVTIDELIRNDKKLQDKITIDEEKTFDKFSDPGFYIGLALVLIGSLLLEGSLADTFIVIGLLTIVFFKDIIKSMQTLIKS